jgi:cell division protein FtsW (lipid II flippase)
LIRVQSNPDAARNNVREGRIFALTLAGGFLVIAVLAMRKDRYRVETVAFSLSAISVLAALAVPGHLEPARRAWMKLGEAIGFVTTPVIMAVVYYVILSPIAIARRLIGRRKPARDSHWHQRPPLPQAERMERQF